MREKLENYQEITKIELSCAITHAIHQSQKVVETLGEKFKPAQSTGNVYPASENIDWIETGNYTGNII